MICARSLCDFLAYSIAGGNYTVEVMTRSATRNSVSAEALNQLVTELVPEDHVHRVDHFLGMSTVLNVLGLRFANRILEPVLNAEHVESVEIVFDESLGLEGRAGFYDHAGALTDMIQSHLLQVLAFVAMSRRARSGAGRTRMQGASSACDARVGR